MYDIIARKTIVSKSIQNKGSREKNYKFVLCQTIGSNGYAKCTNFIVKKRRSRVRSNFTDFVRLKQSLYASEFNYFTYVDRSTFEQTPPQTFCALL